VDLMTFFNAKERIRTDIPLNDDDLFRFIKSYD